MTHNSSNFQKSVKTSGSHGQASSKLTDDAFIDGPPVRDDKSLNYKLFKPYVNGGSTVPLLVMLHGCTQNADDFAAATQMNVLARDNGLFVLYPSQSSTANPNLCWNWYEPAHQHRDSGEPALLNALIREMLGNYPVDPDRVFVAGFCAGGAMALIMAEQYPELFAAVGVHSGLPTGSASSMPEALAAMYGLSGIKAGSSPGENLLNGLAPVTETDSASQIDGPSHEQSLEKDSITPLIVFHGERDLTVSCSNGDHIVSAWLETAGASVESSTGNSNTRQHSTSSGRHCTVAVYANRSNPDDQGCEHWKLREGDHAWSGGDVACSFTDAGGPDASAEMIRFFSDAAATLTC